MRNTNMNGKRILAFGAHPDDIEFGCGALLLDAEDRGAQLNLVVLSRGEAGTQGDGSTREIEARKAAEILGADIQFLPTAGDTQIRADMETILLAAKEIRRVQPNIILAPSRHLNQHPDHRETSLIVRDANRLARYGKTPGLEDLDLHASQMLLFYEISNEGSNGDGSNAILVDISSLVEKWKALMECHASQIKNLDYIDLQLSRARVLGIQMGVHSALRLYPEGPLLASSIAELSALKGQRF
ncbi:MAG: PIG-L family deacetylase [Verrucomicrobia bacterium]|nr:PIG-L family deacetylase [Verrucomicrobiota bacterium]